MRRSALELAAWGLGEAVTPNALDVALHRIRRKLLDEHLSTFTQKQPTTLRKGVLSDFISLDAMLKPGRPDASGQFDFTSQNACLAALSRCPLDGAAVVDAAKDAAKARKVL